jgi:hypothetical protein
MISLKQIGLVLLFLAVWIVLNRWVLPWFGIPTCMSGGCGPNRCPTVRQTAPDRVRGQDASQEDRVPEADDAHSGLSH